MLLLSAFMFSAVAAAQSTCSSFAINGSDSHFDYYRFYDFRNLEPGRPQGLGPQEEDVVPYLSVNDSSWIKDWRPRDQQKQPPTDDAIAMRYNPANVFIGRSRGMGESMLNLYTTRDSEESQSAAELDFIATNITHGSFRVKARVAGDAGAVSGIFTYANDTQETDIELLTRDPPNRMHFSNQPTTDDHGEHIKDASFNVSSPYYTRWNIYRIDWLMDETISYVNGQEMARSSVHVPSERSMFILNMWSNSGKFSGNMRVGGQAVMQVQWVEMAFNRHAKDSLGAPEDQTICALDRGVGAPLPISGASRLASKLVYSPVALWMAILVFF